MKKNKRSRAAALFAVLIAALILYRFYLIPNILFPTSYSEYVERYSEEYQIDKYVIYSVIKAESGFNPNNCSHTGAMGLMQVMPETGSWAAMTMGLNGFYYEKLYEPETNIHIGCWYLRYLLDIYDGSLANALAAYNAGMGNVSKWLEDPQYSSDGVTLDKIPYSETEKYVEKTFKYMEKYEKYYD